MPSIPAIVDQAESMLREVTAQLVRPRAGECLCCYIARLLTEVGCDGSHRHARHYRDTVAPRATALMSRLKNIGACCCDCELFLNGDQLARAPQGGGLVGRLMDDDGDFHRESLPVCQGVRRSSVQPCRNWVRIRKW